MSAPFIRRTVQLGLLSKDLGRLRLSKAEKDRDKARDRVVARLGQMHGLPQKIGQILAFSELSESDGTFSQLTENKASLSKEKAFEEIALQIAACVPDEEELAQQNPRKNSKQKLTPVRLEDYFNSIESEGISASIGQVHRATLTTGEEVAVKIQYPDVVGQIEADLKALGWLTAPLGDLRRGFDLQSYRREIGGMLRSELDYRLEASRIKEFAQWMHTWKTIEVPRVIEALSGDRILTMTWIGGEHFSDVCQWPKPDRRAVAECLLRFFLYSCFEWRLIHADPHPGNYRFSREQGRVKIGLLDFGCVKELDSQLVEGLSGLVHDTSEGTLTNERAWERHVQMGFDPKSLAPIKSKLKEITQILFEPFHSTNPFDVRTWNMGERIAAVLGEHRLSYRVSAPSGMIYLVRVVQGLVQYLKTLNTPIDWRTHLPRIVEKNMELSAGSSSLESAAAAILGEAFDSRDPLMKSETLRIRVTESRSIKVDLTFGAAAVDNLTDLVPRELLPSLEDRSIRLNSIVEKAQQSGYAPGELFTLEDGSKCVRVWLE